MRIDLHGQTIHAAWRIFNTCITDAYYNKHSTIVVITGQGAIMHEFGAWCAQHPHVKTWTNSPQNPGSYKLSLKKG